MIELPTCQAYYTPPLPTLTCSQNTRGDFRTQKNSDVVRNQCSAQMGSENLFTLESVQIMHTQRRLSKTSMKRRPTKTVFLDPSPPPCPSSSVLKTPPPPPFTDTQIVSRVNVRTKTKYSDVYGQHNPTVHGQGRPGVFKTQNTLRFGPKCFAFLDVLYIYPPPPPPPPVVVHIGWPPPPSIWPDVFDGWPLTHSNEKWDFYIISASTIKLY